MYLNKHDTVNAPWRIISLYLLLNRFELRVDDSHHIEMDPKVILKAKYDIKLHLKPLLYNAE